jgi:HD-GYP domain-containing protein (c-di-GMP phosphodiesterase class II)
LTEEEFKHVCNHCDVGERILKPITQDDEILSMVRHHHERYNGTGYPDGIRGGTGISALLWSIIALADAYDAMTSDRPYRKAMTSMQALQEIEAQVGRQFDPIVFKAFLKAVEAINPGGDTNLKPYYLSYALS